MVPFGRSLCLPAFEARFAGFREYGEPNVIYTTIYYNPNPAPETLNPDEPRRKKVPKFIQTLHPKPHTLKNPPKQKYPNYGKPTLVLGLTSISFIAPKLRYLQVYPVPGNLTSRV